MHTGLQVVSTARDGYAVVTATGEIDLATADQLRSAVVHAIGLGTPLIVDLSAITFTDSSALYVLLSGNRAATDLGTFLAVIPSPAAARVLELSGADRILTLRRSETEAVVSNNADIPAGTHSSELESAGHSAQATT